MKLNHCPSGINFHTLRLWLVLEYRPFVNLENSCSLCKARYQPSSAVRPSLIHPVQAEAPSAQFLSTF